MRRLALAFTILPLLVAAAFASECGDAGDDDRPIVDLYNSGRFQEVVQRLGGVVGRPISMFRVTVLVRSLLALERESEVPGVIEGHRTTLTDECRQSLQAEVRASALITSRTREWARRNRPKDARLLVLFKGPIEGFFRFGYAEFAVSINGEPAIARRLDRAGEDIELFSDVVWSGSVDVDVTVQVSGSHYVDRFGHRTLESSEPGGKYNTSVLSVVPVTGKHLVEVAPRSTNTVIVRFVHEKINRVNLLLMEFFESRYSLRFGEPEQR